jgi:hypothetical protein
MNDHSFIVKGLGAGRVTVPRVRQHLCPRDAGPLVTPGSFIETSLT